MRNKPEQTAVKSDFVRSVFAEYGAALHSFFVRRLHRDQDAKDLAQEVYLRLMRFGDAELVREPHAYVFHIACQVVGQHRLKSKRDPVTFDSEIMDSQSDNAVDAHRDEPLEQLNAQRELGRIRAALSKLPPMHRKVIMMRRWDGASRTEIASQLNLSVHTVKKYIAEANAQLGLALWSDE